MQIIDFIEQCHQYIKIGKNLPKRKVSYKFLKQFGSHILNEYYSINIEYSIFVTKLNEIDQLAIIMVVNVYRKTPFYSIGYHYDITLKTGKNVMFFLRNLT